MEAALAREARSQPPWISSQSMEQVKASLDQRLKQVLTPVFEAYKADLRARNAAIDTQASYRAVMNLCPKW